MKIPFLGQAYENRSIPVSSQRCINWYPETQPATARDDLALEAVSGITLFSALDGGAIRGMCFAEALQELYVVAGQNLYKIIQSGSSTLLGQIDGGGLVAMAANRTQIAIATGVSAWIYDKALGLTKETQYGPVRDVAYQDEFFIFVSTDGQQFKLSGLFDGRKFDPVDVASAQANPDPILAVTQVNRRLWFNGTDSGEPWFNSGAFPFPFSPIDGGSFNGYGLPSTFGIVVADSTLYWVSNDRRIYRLEGYTPVRISHFGIENSLREYDTVSDAEAMAWTENGHRFIAFSFPSGGQTWVFDSSTGMWHQRSSGVKDGIWRGRFAVLAWGKTLIGDRIEGNVGELDLDVFTEYGETMRARRTSPVISADQRPVFIDRLEIVAETGRAGQTEDPQARLSWSNDGGVTFGNSVWASLGKIGEYRTRLTWWRLGFAQNRVFDLQITDSVRRNLISCVAEGEAGEI